MYPKDSFAAAFIAALISSFVTPAFLTTAVKIVVEPVGAGTRCAEPINFPFNSGITNPIAFAAPVLLGTMLTAAARDLLKSPFLCGPSRCHLITCVSVDCAHDTGLDWSIICLMHLAIGAKQFVVQEAAEMIVSEAFNVSWFVLYTIVGRSLPAGAEITTLRAPALICACAFSLDV